MLENLRLKFRKFRYSFHRFWEEVWPINWKKFDLNILANSVPTLPYSLKVLLILFSATTVIFSVVFFYSFYIAITVPKAQQSGYVREVVFGKMEVFNPVLDNQSDAEQKINRLLYHPLYEVSFPDYLAGETSEDVKIEPILLSEKPIFVDLENDANDRYKKLKMVLREDVYWSNGKKIDMEDVHYSFRRLQEDGGNSYFRSLFRGLTFHIVDEKEFWLVSQEPNPRLIHLSNFTPIPKNYYDSSINSRLLVDERSQKPLVSSGYFVFSEKSELPNPINPKEKVQTFEKQEGLNAQVMLQKNLYQNHKDIYLQNYIFIKRQHIRDVSSDIASLERDIKNNRVELALRSVDFFNPQKTNINNIAYNQKVLSTNIFYNIYFNAQQSESGFLVNQTLRNYIACHMINYQYAESDFIKNIEKENRILPLHFNQEFLPECGQDYTEILDKNFYLVGVSGQNNEQKQIYLRPNLEVKLTMIGYPQYRPLLEDIKKYFEEVVGLPINLVDDEQKVNTLLDNKQYHLAILPLVMIDQNPYSVYGEGGNNLSAINRNSRFLDYKFEENIKKYSTSNLQDQPTKDILLKFFSEQFVSLNLLKTNKEIIYSNKVKDFDKNLSSSYNSLSQIYQDLPSWHTQLKRELIWFRKE